GAREDEPVERRPVRVSLGGRAVEEEPRGRRLFALRLGGGLLGVDGREGEHGEGEEGEAASGHVGNPSCGGVTAAILLLSGAEPEDAREKADASAGGGPDGAPG